MLSLRNLRHGITAVSPTVFLPLLVNNGYNATQIFRHQIRVSSSHRPVCEFINSSLINLYLPIVILGMSDGFSRQMHSLSTFGGAILVQARDPAKLSMEIENAIDDNRFNDAWKLFEQHMHMEGFPRKSIVNKLLARFAESIDVQWLEKAYGLVEQAVEESKQNLLEKEPLIYLSFGLAKCGLSVPASTIRRLIEMELYPPVTAWSAILAHMSQTAPGAYLTAELILEIGYLFQGGRVDPRKKSNAPLIAMKPNTTSVNIALAGCLLFGKTRKAEQLLDMMPHIILKSMQLC
ncbi:hypothetical protein GH714_003746 [Hevea brasiliensis]|uniref:At1g68980-like TPR repeats domain-containing protein n=1 Tax=Hevea brasiliensis TaxID=3981 RepID=A0A6A6KPG9_HEVBR|nr:hypothetical protein GH714_003746 [Hevea brasiliensis]